MEGRYNIAWLTEKIEAGEQPKFLFFWGHTKPLTQEVSNSCFSQWYESPFTIDGVKFQTTEHWMMAQKALLFENHEIHQKIISAKKPGEAKALGREVIGFDEKIWQENRMEIVRIGNIHKFNQNKKMGEHLLNTKNRILVEASPVDTIWGIGLAKEDKKVKSVDSWRGLNLLGFALMEARDFIAENGFFNYRT